MCILDIYSRQLCRKYEKRVHHSIIDFNYLDSVLNPLE